eukprot:108957-Amphidinium_carterae.4
MSKPVGNNGKVGCMACHFGERCPRTTASCFRLSERSLQDLQRESTPYTLQALISCRESCVSDITQRARTGAQGTSRLKRRAVSKELHQYRYCRVDDDSLSATSTIE